MSATLTALWPTTVRWAAALLTVMMRVSTGIRAAVANPMTTTPPRAIPRIRRPARIRAPNDPGIAKTWWFVGTSRVPRSWH
ncbi:hypothetical protein [Kocuria marina]|uniref:hypothetical protein n=1 Tax=Kocuria marina TaxID=223184 RepID=UPI0012EB7E78|nr:hypothetical protein [Kocuria marina]